ncbi:hypothetical protein L198_01449 [Cryptococcus wingfieldii CBS 7118]|uniref:DNA-directed RNA polymerase III subunit n=1 Tax=Cryptococcus wingfieldii CBS 7118 TaxID=1295528 RepID=A0A1E3K160_9TREE|nr:hypothetical protein L198_01449 [Cryptococcus wingfieldii CBS 7118]ODO06217.1 hypothetical protein L198_01449 [Cryptococcus wingfieldii CBS 7118]
MSRGGFRGGRGGGRGGMPPGVGYGYGQISQTEWKEGISRIKAQSQNRGVLYPPLDSNSTSYLTAPTEHESMILSHEIALETTLSSGKLPQNDPGAQIVQPGQVPPWRIASERKVVGIEIESYSDRFNAPAPTGSSKLDPLALRMDQAMFPPALWSAYFDGQADEGKRPKKRRKVDDLDGDDDKVEEESQITEEEDFDFDDDESDHQDYDANYFDNGEGDDDDEGDDEGGDAYED